MTPLERLTALVRQQSALQADIRLALAECREDGITVERLKEVVGVSRQTIYTMLGDVERTWSIETDRTHDSVLAAAGAVLDGTGMHRGGRLGYEITYHGTRRQARALVGQLGAGGHTVWTTPDL
jgi:DNA-binding XRE family transcriptional regulator